VDSSREQNILARFVTNPLLVREMRRSKKGVAHSALKFGFGLSLAITPFGLIGLLISPEIDHIRLVLSLFFLVIAPIPPFLAYTAVLIAVTELRGRPFELLYLTTMSDARLVEGYIVSTLHRNRRLLFLVIGSTPLAIFWLTYISTYEDYVRCLFNTSQVCQVSPSFISMLSALAAFILIGISVIGICLLSTTLGVLFAAWWRNKFFASITAIMLALSLVVVLVVLSITFSISQLLQRLMIYLPVAYILCGLALLTARPLARRHKG